MIPTIIIGIVAGFLAGKIMKGSGYGILIDLVLGLLGGLVGGYVVGLLGLGGGGSGSGRRDDRSRIHELLATRVDAQIEALERAGAEQDHVAVFREHDLVIRFRSPGVDDGVSDVPIDRASVGRSETQRLLSSDPK
jgi:uncharacterized membrane protein YeaQ/YmgE (transglycosylase-associated protein family)